MGESVPAVPLVTHHPYFSVWSPADELHASSTIHWTGATHSLMGIVAVDGDCYRFAGRDESVAEELPVADQTSREIGPTTTTYTFAVDGIELVIEFTSPLLLDDLDLLSRPATYVTATTRSTDGDPHSVRVYLDITGEWAVNDPNQPVTWNRVPVTTSRGDAIEALRIGTTEQDVLGHVGDDVRIDWGYLYLVPPTAPGTMTAIGTPDIRTRYQSDETLPESDLTDSPRPVGDQPPVLATAFDLDVTPTTTESAFLIIGYDDRKAVEYFGEPLKPYWQHDGTDAQSMLAAALREYDDVRERCREFDATLYDTCLKRGGEEFVDICALAYRQAIAAHTLVEHEGDALYLSKECFSNGCIGTVDVTYPSTPLFYRFNPELVKGMLRPVFRYARTDDWPFEFAPHDVGTYPKANGQVYGRDEETGEFALESQMPVEECGNILIVTAGVCLREDDPSFAKEHWELLTDWATYLVDNGYDPGEQLCTDDFAGHLAHNVNLSVKAIFGIASYGLLCSLRGKDEAASEYLTLAAEMANKWKQDADDGDHYRLAFDQPGTWSLKYNLVWDRLFNLDLFGDDVRETEVNKYKQEQRIYGTPLDSRESYTKTDWEIWAATLTTDQDTFRELIEPIRAFLHDTPDHVPFTDWYHTESAEQINFQHRSVIGGVFMPLLSPDDFTPTE